MRATYWVTSVIVGIVMFAGGLSMLFIPANRTAIIALGFPGWLSYEIGLGKVLGVLAFILPGSPPRLRDAASVGFAIVLVSAALAHHMAGDPPWRASEPLGFLVLLGVSTWARGRLATA